MESTNLKQKIQKYMDKGMSEEDIIEKIKLKAQEIINFGQTPHKLLDNFHPKREPQKKTRLIEENLTNSDPQNKKEKDDVIGTFKKGVKYCFQNPISICILNGNKEIEIYNKDPKKKKVVKIILKPCEKLNMVKCLIYKNDVNNRNPTNIPLNHEKYFCLDLQNSKYIVSCRHLDKSIKFYYNDKIKDILLQSFVSCIAKTPDDRRLFTGHINGKICCWNIVYENNNDNISINLIEEFLAHEECVNCIVIQKELNIIISAGDVILYFKSLGWSCFYQKLQFL